MKRHFHSVFQFLILVLITIFTTVIVFHCVRPPKINSLLKNGMPVAPDEILHVIPNKLIRTKTNSREKIDWHNYTQMKLDLARTGNGEKGLPAVLPSNFNQGTYDELYKVNGFNGYLSDQIALDRAVPDIRHPGCKKKKYLGNLPSVSVVVPFHNEHLSTLLRTAISVVNRSPPHLLKEIILTDDFSTKDIIKKPLDDYIAKHLPKVKVIRLPKRVGLIRARLAGAEVATGEVLIFLDSHSEANINWLPPLLEPIAEDPKTCVCPFIDVVAEDTFEYRAQDEGKRGAFDWSFFYKRLPKLPEDEKKPTEPFKSPVMAGGLFAINREFFWDLGGYDPGLDIWGGEQYELSFKIWQCGGQMVDAPCSRVGHIYRKFAPFPNPGIGDFVGRNYRRVAEVWMDEYAEYLYKRRPHYRNINPGDLTAQLAIRKRLNCKPFKWFMKEVAFDLTKSYPVVEPPHFAHGRISNKVAEELCAAVEEHKDGQKVLLKSCGSGSDSRKFDFTWHKDIRDHDTDHCWDVSDPNDKAIVTLFQCHGQKGNQLWKYDVNKKWLVHGANQRCLDADLSRRSVYVTTCDVNSETQRWLFENIDFKQIAKYDRDDLTEDN